MRRSMVAVWLILLLGAVTVSAQEPTAEADVTLTEPITSDDGTYSILYPAGWYARTDGDSEFTLSNTEEGLDRDFDEAIVPGEVLVGVLFGPADEVLEQLGVGPSSSMTDALTLGLELISENIEAEAGEVEALSIDDRRAAAATLTLEKGDGYIAFIDWNDTTLVVLVMLTAPGERDQWLPVGIDIVSSLTPAQAAAPTQIASVEVPALTETYTREDIGLTVSYPEGWEVRDGSPNNIDIASSEAVFDQWFYDPFAPGDVRMMLAYGEIDLIFEEAPPEDANPSDMLVFAVAAEHDDRVTYETPEPLSFRDHEAALIRATQENSETYAILVDYGDGMVLIATVQTAPGELDAAEALLNEMLETIEIE